MKSLLIVGAGQYGQLIKEIAIINNFDTIDFLDDNSELAIGKIDQLENIQTNYDYAICSIGNAELREKTSKNIRNKVTLIHPQTIISNSSQIGLGCVIEAGTIISSNTIIEDGCFICAGAVVNHNSVIEKYSQVDCNAVIKGKVPEKMKIEACTLWKG